MKPPLYFTRHRLDRIKNRIKGDPAFRVRWENLRLRGGELLESEWTTEKPSAETGAQYVNFRAPAQRLAELVQTLSVLHSVEPDERYAKKIRDGLLFYADECAGYSHWCSAPFRLSRNPPWRSELITASLCLTYATGLAVLRDWLPNSERERIVAALVNKGIIPLLQDWLWPATRIHTLDSMGHNWWIVCVSLAGVGAIGVVNEHPDAVGWLEEIDRAIPQWFGYQGNLLDNKAANFDVAGGYYEGVHYADYAVMEYLLYRTARRDVFPDRKDLHSAELENVADFFLHTFYPARTRDLIVNFGDTQHNQASTMSMRLLVENGLAGGHAQWYVKRTSDRDKNALGLLLESDLPAVAPDAPTSALFPGAGWATLRSGWEEDATLLAVRSGIYWIHAHADSGSFVLFHRGQPLISDPGHCDYSHPEYADYFASSRAHNVVLVDGQGAHREDFARGSKFNGNVYSLIDDGGLKYVHADAAGPMAHLLKRHYRHWLWVDGVIIIFDDLLSHQAARFQWLLHYSGSAKWEAPSVEICNGEAGATLEFLYPKRLEMQERQAPAQDTIETSVSYMEFSTIEPSRQQNSLCVIKPNLPVGEKVSAVELIELPNVLGARILTGETVTEVYFNLLADGRLEGTGNSHAIIGCWKTDAALLAVTRGLVALNEGRHSQRLLVVNGSYVESDGVTLLDSLSSVDCLIIWDGDQMNVTLHGQPLIDLRVWSRERPEKIRVNGTLTSFEFDVARQSVRLQQQNRAQKP